MKPLQTVYCNHQFIDDCVRKQKESSSHKIAYKILELLSDVVVDFPKEQLIDIISKNQFYNTLIKRENKRVICDENWGRDFKADNIADQMYFIKPGYIPNHKQLRDDYGCLIVSSDDDIHILSRMNRQRIYCLTPNRNKPKDIEYENLNTWNEVINPIKIRPINSAIIMDNFMFSKLDKFERRKHDSLYAILREIVPSRIKTSFHLSLFMENGQGTLSKEYAAEVIKEIKEMNLCDDMKVTIIAHTKKSTTHDRVLVTNYHYLYAGSGFSVIDEDGVQEMTKGQIQSTFHDIVDICGIQTIKHTHCSCIYWAGAIINSIYNPNSFIVGDQENRLLQYI